MALIVVMALVFFPRGGASGAGESPRPSTGSAAAVSPSPVLGQYLAGAVGARADCLAAILDDGTVKPITRFGGQQIWRIAYSPDGKLLACIAGTFKRSELWVFDATGDGRQASASVPDLVAVDSIAWLSPTELLLAGFEQPPKATGENAVFSVYDVQSGRSTPLMAGPARLIGVSVSASHDGSKVAFVSYTDHKTGKYGMVTAKERLQVLDRSSGSVTELGVNNADFDVNARAYDDPLISPSGRAIIYRRAGSDVGTSYTVIGTDGSVLMPEFEALMPSGYAWDPTGSKVIFTGRPVPAANGDGPLEFWLFDLTRGGMPLMIASPAGQTSVQGLSWSPDGETIAWSAWDKKYRSGTTYLMAATGGASTPLAEQALSPVWAPGAAPPLQTSPSP